MSDEIGLLHYWIDEHRDELVEDLRGVLRIPSKKEEAAGGNAPYGTPIREALDYTLALCGRLGFSTKDVDGHAGHAEFGVGEEMIGVLGHLDVVPEGDRWSYPPFGAEIHDGFIYARGASDDKGPMFAALYGAKALMESGLPLRRRVRLIFGCDEESGFGCVKHYWEVAEEERPTYAFTPDADFPLIFAEKGIANLVLEHERKPGSGNLTVAEFAGGRRANMVPDHAEARLVGEPADLYAAVAQLSKYWDKNVDFTPVDGAVAVRAMGKSAHGSTPQIGDNAVARLARALVELPLTADHDWLQWLARTNDPTGGELGIAGRDDVAGPLTCNLGVVKLAGDKVTVTYNVRYPVTWKIDDLVGRLLSTITGTGWTLASHTDSQPLYVPLDQEPVKTLLDVYRLETGDHDTKPATTGGGTYARATPNAVAFGPGFPGGSDGPAHEVDERIAIDSLLRAAKIYAHALYQLAR